ncbi:MAG TPA: uroporphyrinogen decarboxylase family protein, partial [Verrucomicrobiae bacterium]
AAFGDIALVPAAWMKHPKGIRDVAEWYISTKTRRDYVYSVFEQQCAIALKNITTLIDLFGDLVQAAFVTGTDFGTQRGPFISLKSYRDLFKPFHKQVTALLHRRSNWKAFIHSCGSVYQLIPDFLDAGFDILNPVQCSAAEMDAARLKREFGAKTVFWGGGVDTQKTLPFGTAEQVYREVRERIGIFNQAGGFVFNSVHNIQGNTPVENIEAMFKAVRDSRRAG